MRATDIIEAKTITRHTYLVLKKQLDQTDFFCNHCDKPIGIGDKIGRQMDGTLEGFMCIKCFKKVLEAQRMN